MTKNNKNCILEFWRFVFCLLVGAHHLYHIYIPEPYPFYLAWIYVEFFFIVTGYFTARHFANYISDADVVDDVCKYVYKKFRPLFPYVVIAVSSQYIIECFAEKMINGVVSFMTILPNYICEIFLATSTNYHTNHVGPMWYMSALFLIFPIVCYLLRNPRTKKIYMFYISWFFPLMYYGKTGVSGAGVCGNMVWPHQLLRAFACVSLGVFVFVISERLKNWKIKEQWVKVTTGCILTVFEFLCFGMTIYFTANNMDYLKVIIMLFVFGLITLFSEKSYTCLIKGKVFLWLGKLSTVYFLIQWSVGTYMDHYLHIENDSKRIIIYYVLSIAVSIISILAVNQVKKAIAKKKVSGADV